MQLTDRKAWSESITILLKAHKMDFWEVAKVEWKRIEFKHIRMCNNIVLYHLRRIYGSKHPGYIYIDCL